MSEATLVHKGAECFLIKSNKIQAEDSRALSGVYFLGLNIYNFRDVNKTQSTFPLQ